MTIPRNAGSAQSTDAIESSGFVRQQAARLCTAGSIVMCGTTLMTLAARQIWLADILANLRIQQLLALIACVLLAAFFRSRLLVVLCGICIAIHGVAFVAGRPSLPSQPLRNSIGTLVGQKSVSGIKLTTANVLTTNKQYSDVECELISLDADVVAVIEISSGLRDHLAGDFSKIYPHSIVDFQDNGNFGIGLYSKLPWESAELITFNDSTLLSAIATLRHSKTTWRIIATHTLPPMGRRHFEHRNLHLQQLAQMVASLRASDSASPVVVMGDLNITPWSPIFQRFVNDAGLLRTGTGSGATPTWYRFPIFPFGLVLDHILATKDVLCQSHRISSDVGSDHRFVTAELICHENTE